MLYHGVDDANRLFCIGNIGMHLSRNSFDIGIVVGTTRLPLCFLRLLRLLHLSFVFLSCCRQRELFFFDWIFPRRVLPGDDVSKLDNQSKGEDVSSWKECGDCRCFKWYWGSYSLSIRQTKSKVSYNFFSLEILINVLLTHKVGTGCPKKRKIRKGGGKMCWTGCWRSYPCRYWRNQDEWLWVRIKDIR